MATIMDRLNSYEDGVFIIILSQATKQGGGKQVHSVVFVETVQNHPARLVVTTLLCKTRTVSIAYCSSMCK